MLKGLLKVSFLLAIITLFSACGGSSENNHDHENHATSASDNNNNNQPEANSNTATEAPKLTTIEAFWAEFQAAVKAKDQAKIKSLSEGDAVESQMEQIVEGEAYNRLISSTVDQLATTDMAMPMEATDVYELHLNYAYDTDGNLLPENHEEEDFLDSSELYYFGKINGEYRWIAFMAAG